MICDMLKNHEHKQYFFLKLYHEPVLKMCQETHGMITSIQNCSQEIRRGFFSTAETSILFGGKWKIVF